MPNFANCGWLWSTWEIVKSLSPSPVIFFSCIPPTRHVISLSWLGYGHVITIMTSINRFLYFNLKLENPRPPLKQIVLFRIIIGTVIYLKILLSFLKLLHHQITAYCPQITLCRDLFRDIESLELKFRTKVTWGWWPYTNLVQSTAHATQMWSTGRDLQSKWAKAMWEIWAISAASNSRLKWYVITEAFFFFPWTWYSVDDCSIAW